MILRHNKTPVVVVNCKLGGLGVMRSLGRLGVALYGVDPEPSAPAFYSRYCRRRYQEEIEFNNSDHLCRSLEIIRNEHQDPTILIPTSDDTTLVVATHKERLREAGYRFQFNSADLIKRLISKEGMYKLAIDSGVPVPHTLFPLSITDVHRYIDEVGKFPVMLKAIDGTRLFKRTGLKMMIVHAPAELLRWYERLDEPGMPNLMLQEYIPGDDDQIYIFNGYFDAKSECLAGFTGHKIRQYPVHVGCASLGICKWNQDVSDITVAFMKAVGYQGILDIGYRYDPRDGQYKVLDINPRVGQAFRLFVAEDGLDVVRALYLDLTGQEVPKTSPREGRRWLIEDMDIISSLHYRREGTLSIWGWIKSFRGVEEAAWFSWRDPVPFLRMLGSLLRKFMLWAGKSLVRKRSPSTTS